MWVVGEHVRRVQRGAAQVQAVWARGTAHVKGTGLWVVVSQEVNGRIVRVVGANHQHVLAQPSVGGSAGIRVLRCLGVVWHTGQEGALLHSTQAAHRMLQCLLYWAAQQPAAGQTLFKWPASLPLQKSKPSHPTATGNIEILICAFTHHTHTIFK